MPFRRRHRRWIALIALFGLLFQQLAMAAYACPVDGNGVTGSVAAQMPPCHATGTADKSRCHQHCHPLAQTSDHAATPALPPALLPPTRWLREPVALVGGRDFTERNLQARSNAPPLTIQHCTFQI
ncbi:MAG TPA: hypothetical protein VFE67_12450 [Rudaea sp.]|jgi:hypothetical protein|nr:hypothetical protein [Rudaea sp.]